MPPQLSKADSKDTYHTALSFREVLENELKRLILRRVVNKTQLLLDALENTESARDVFFSTACAHEYSKVNSFAA